MIKQTRGALNFLIASYKAILKHAALATALASVAMVSTANAKTYDLSDDSLFSDPVLSNINIEDDNDGSDTLVTIASNPSFDSARTVYFLSNHQGNMTIDKGAKINAISVDLYGGTFDAQNSSIMADSLYIKKTYSRNNIAKFGILSITSRADVDNAAIQVNNLF